jgi:hypothetical protein
MGKIIVVQNQLILPPSAKPQSVTWGTVMVKQDNGGSPLIHVHRGEESVDRELVVWVPDKVLKKLVPDGAVVVLRSETFADGERRFSPIGKGDRSLGPFLPFYAYAFVCGMAIRCKATKTKMTKHFRHTYRAMWFLFQRALKMRQHICRRFTSTKDLVVARSGRRSKDANETHILPWQFDKITKKMGYPQSVAALLELGRKAARKAGISRPNSSQKIHYGLAKLAHLNLKSLKPEEVVRVLKSVLFDIDPRVEPIPSETRAQVVERILTAIHAHLDNTSAVFDDWFWGKHNSFIKQIAKQVKSPGGKLDPEVVEQVLLELGWEAYEYVGQCVFAWARDMQKAMPDPLTADEKRAFELLYFPQPEFGGIPLILLAEKLQFVDTILDEIINHPGDEHPIQVLYQLLQFYAVLISNRREADVRIKDATKATRKWLKKESGQTSGGEAVSEVKDPTDSQDRCVGHEAALALYNRVAKAKEITCECSKPDWDVEPEAMEDSPAFRLTFVCNQCEKTQTVEISVDELQKLQSQLK